ncbi:MAG: DUF1501 domain-containing protein [Planctomycetaceae bacterium]
MLSLLGPGFRTAQGVSRREMIRIGGLSMGGVGLNHLLSKPANAASSTASHGPGFGRAKRAIILYLSGGHPQHDMFDPKPDAPAEIRGEFGTIETSVPTLRFGEHCPLSAKLMNQMALVRSMNHTHNDHGRGSYWMFTGYMYPGSVPDVNSMSRQDMPHMGSCLAKIAPGSGPMFPFIIVPHRMDVAGGRRAGQFAGMLGPKFDPMLTGGNPNDDSFRLEHIPLVPNEDPGIIRRRLGLVDQLNQQVDYLREQALSQSLKENQVKALDVVGSDAVRKAVDLSVVDSTVREKYGRNLFGQSVLLGRRLLQAGTRLVQCNWQRAQGKNGFAWDTHWNNFSALKEELIPAFDQAFYALMTDLAQTGELAETLVVVASEFGRSPKVTLKNGGREHWPELYNVLLAGAGIQGGQVYGASDRLGAYPAENPVGPADFVATIYHMLGIDPHTELRDPQDRPFQLSKGNPFPLQMS